MKFIKNSYNYEKKSQNLCQNSDFLSLYMSQLQFKFVIVMTLAHNFNFLMFDFISDMTYVIIMTFYFTILILSHKYDFISKYDFCPNYDFLSHNLDFFFYVISAT